MLLEREKELALLTGLLPDLGDGGGKVILVRGEAGIGKSILVREFARTAAASARFLVGFCDDLQTPQPFGPLWDIAGDEPGLRLALENQERHGVLQECFALLSDSATPTVMVIEDIQWSDEATLDALTYVGRRVERTNGLLCLTYRDGEVDHHHPLRRVMGDLAPGSVVRIALSGLSHAAVAEIVSPSGLNPDRVLEATGGNPFLVTEMALTTGEEVPTSVRESVTARVARLSAAAQEMLRRLSVIPRRLTLADASSLAGASLGELSECENVGLLAVQDGIVSFRHELIRRAIEASLTISEGIALHRALLDVIPEGADPAWLAYHARGGSDIDRLVSLAPRAAEAALAVGSNREAAAQLRTVGPHLTRLEPGARADILSKWALIEHYLENADAAGILDKAIELRRELGSGESLARDLVRGVEVNRTYGHFETAKDMAREAIEILEGNGPAAELAAALVAEAWLLINMGHIDEAETVVDRAIATAEATGAEPALISGLGVKGVLLYVRGQPGGLDLLEELRQRAKRGNHRYEEVMSLLRMAVVALEIRDIDRAVDFAGQARSTAARYELPVLETEATAISCRARWWGGDWTGAEDLAADVLGRKAKSDIHVAAALGTIRMRTGRSGGDNLIEQAWALATESDEIDHLLASATALAERMWIEGRPDEDRLERFGELVERGVRSEYPWPAGSLALWLWKLGKLDLPTSGLPEPYRRLSEGDVEGAAESWRILKIPYERAATLMSGDQEQRLQSLELLESLGASVPASRVRQELRADGITPPRGRGRATRGNRAGLTARQAEVLQLLAAGLSNVEIADRLFVSPRTIETHVAAVMGKLGCSSRNEAVATGRREGLIAD